MGSVNEENELHTHTHRRTHTHTHKAGTVSIQGDNIRALRIDVMEWKPKQVQLSANGAEWIVELACLCSNVNVGTSNNNMPKEEEEEEEE